MHILAVLLIYVWRSSQADKTSVRLSFAFIKTHPASQCTQSLGVKNNALSKVYAQNAEMYTFFGPCLYLLCLPLFRAHSIVNAEKSQGLCGTYLGKAVCYFGHTLPGFFFQKHLSLFRAYCLGVIFFCLWIFFPETLVSISGTLFASTLNFFFCKCCQVLFLEFKERGSQHLP